MKNTKEKTNTTTSTMLRHLNDLLKICSHPTLVDDRDDVVVPSSAYYDITSSCKLVALKELLLSCGIGTISKCVGENLNFTSRMMNITYT